VCLQEVVQGVSLAQMVSSGKRASEEEVLRVATDLLSILKYLSGQEAARVAQPGLGGWPPLPVYRS
jgi:hypothetical protein